MLFGAALAFADGPLATVGRYPSVGTMERQTLLDLLNTTNAKKANPSSFVEFIEWLIIGAIVAGLAIAGGTAAAVGLAGVTVGLLGIFGVFNSHRNRRRQQDFIGPCESSNPLDTNDPDCFQYRWKLMTDYYPYHNRLNKLQRFVVQGEDEVQAAASRVESDTERNTVVLFGTGGTGAKPSTRSGVSYEGYNVLVPVTDHLSTWTASVYSEFWKVLQTIDAHSIQDRQDLRDNVTGALDLMLGGVIAATDRQSQSAGRNLEILTRAATSALLSTVETMMEYQHQRVKTSVDLALPAKRLYTAHDARIVSLETALGRADQHVQQGAASMLADVEGLQRDTVKEYSQMATLLDESAKDGVQQTQNVWDHFEQTLVDLSVDAMRSFLNDLGPAVTQTREKTSAMLASAEGAVDETLIRNSTQNLDRVESGVKESLLTATNAVGRHERLAVKADRDIAASGAKLAELTAGASQAARNTAESLSVEIDNHKSDFIRKVFFSTNSASKLSSAAVTALLGAFSFAQSIAGNRQTESESHYSDETDRVLNSLGAQNVVVARSSRDLTGLLGVAHDLSSASVDGRVNAVVETWNSEGQKLMGQVGQVGDRLGQDQAGIAAAQVKAELGVSEAVTTGRIESLKALLRTVAFASRIAQSVGSQRADGAANATAISSESSGELHLLKTAAVTTEKGTHSASQMLDQIASSTALNLERMGMTAADGADSVADALAHQISAYRTAMTAEMQKCEVAKSRSLSTISKASLGEIEKLLKQGLYHDAIAAVSGETKRVERVRDNADSLVHNLDESVMKSDDSLSARRDQLMDRMRQIRDRDNGTIAKFNVSAASLSDDLGAAAEFLINYGHQADAALRAHVKDQLMKSAFLSDRLVMDSGSVQSLARVGGAVSSFSDDQKKQLLDALIANVTDTVSIKAVLGNATRLQRVLSEATQKYSLKLSGIVDSIQFELNRIPSQIQQALADPLVVNVSTNIDAAIQQLRERLAVASTQDERDRLIADEIVLLKLKNLAGYLTDVQFDLQRDVDTDHRNALTALGNTSNVLKRMAETVAVINSKENSRSTINTYLQSIAEDSATLLNGMRVFTDEQRGAVARSALANAKDAEFDLKFHDNRQTFVSQGSFKRVENVSAAVEAVVGAALIHSDRLRDDIDTLSHVSQSSDSSINRQIRAVLNGVNGAADRLEIATNATTDDVLTKLAVVRYSTATLQSLARDFGAQMTGKLGVMNIGFNEMLNAVETDAVTSLTRDAGTVRNRSFTVETFKNAIEDEYEAEDNVENDLNLSLDSLVGTLDSLNEDKYNATLVGESELNRMVQLEAAVAQNASDSVNQLLDTA